MQDLKDFNLTLFTYMCAERKMVCKHVQVMEAEEGSGSPGTEVIGSCVLPDVGWVPLHPTRVPLAFSAKNNKLS